MKILISQFDELREKYGLNLDCISSQCGEEEEDEEEEDEEEEDEGRR
jgi:hypothetical protein